MTNNRDNEDVEPEALLDAEIDVGTDMEMDTGSDAERSLEGTGR